MRTTRVFRVTWILLVFLPFLTSCGGTSSGDTIVWIDAPLPGGRVAPGEEVIVQSHAFSKSGIAEIELSVDGEPFSRGIPLPVGGDRVMHSQSWIATSPGMHRLQVAAFNVAGEASNPQLVMIEVVGDATVPQIEENMVISDIMPGEITPTGTPPPSIVP
jgi:hypothetical protein